MPFGRLAAAAAIAAALSFAPLRTHAQRTEPDEVPQSVDAFRATVARILEETGVPGAGLALVHGSGIEWTGGVGLADRERGIPVTADTPFLAGSVSKSFIALGLVQLSEEGLIDLDDPVSEFLPEVAIHNPWEDTDPVRVVHLLQHTAGFDDMHFREIYNLDDAPDLALEEVLRRSPSSRNVRWRPGTRMSYSNPGYAVAAMVLEKVSVQSFEDYVDEHILHPIGMRRSGFRRTADDEAAMARGYADRTGPSVPFPRIYLRPAGGLHTTPRDLGAYVQMLLGWGEIGTESIVDPEYLSNMEHPRTTLAFDAGLRYGYGSGVFWWVDAPYALLGHGGAIDGFTAGYAYSPARDAGIVVLLNRSGARQALERVISAGIRYLKRDVEAPVQPRVDVPPASLAALEGYYHDASPRNQLFAFLDWITAGRTVTATGGELSIRPVRGETVTLVPVSDRLFRTETQIQATHVFAEDETGQRVLTGVTSGGAGGVYAERVPRWRIEIVRVPVLVSALVLFTPALALLPWLLHARGARPRGFWGLKGVLLLLPVVLLVAPFVFSGAPLAAFGTLSYASAALFLASVALPVLSITAAALAFGARREGASRLLTAFAALIASAGMVVSIYVASWGLVGFRSWTY